MEIAKTVVKTVERVVDPVEFFALLSSNGKKDNCIMLESADMQKTIGEKSIGGCNPSLRLFGKGTDFEIQALNLLGEKIIQSLKDDFGFCEKIRFSKSKISGSVKEHEGIVSEEERLKVPTLADVIRTVGFKFKSDCKETAIPNGVFGAISYDFIDQFEKLPKNKSDITKDPDFDMVFLDNLFIIDHKENKTLFAANYFPELESEKEGRERCEKIISEFQERFSQASERKFSKEDAESAELKKSSDTSKEEFISMVEKCKEHIIAGDVFQIVVSKTTIIEPVKNALLVYKALRALNPSPYMFYFKTESGTLFGSSPETFIKVSNLQGGDKKVEIRPIAGTKPRGFAADGRIDADLDSRLENELKTDEKELAEHTMLVDLARNDVARVSKPGTRVLDRPQFVEKYSHVMHLVSNVSGILKEGLDALHVYLASMNMGTLSGAPKVKAMELIRKFEKNKRGFYGGSIGYLTSKGEFDSAIVIRSIRLKGEKAFIRSGSGIVFDSVPEKEFDEAERKARACIKAIEAATQAGSKGGSK